MAIWIVLAAHIGQDSRVERVRWQQDRALVDDTAMVEGHVVSGALNAGDKVYTLKATHCGTAVREVRRIQYPDGAESIEPDDVQDLPSF